VELLSCRGVEDADVTGAELETSDTEALKTMEEVKRCRELWSRDCQFLEEDGEKRKKTNEGINIFLCLQKLFVLFAMPKHRRRARRDVLEDEANNGLSPGHEEGKGAVEMGNVATLNSSEGFVAARESVSFVGIKGERRRTPQTLPQPLLQQAATTALPNALERALRREV
jgi:hypothetical protein